MYRSITIDDHREVVVDKYFIEDIWELAFGSFRQIKTAIGR